MTRSGRFTLRFLIALLLSASIAGCALQLPVHAERATEFEDFGDNPAGLTMLAYVPRALKPGAPLVVALHHCFQKAEQYGDEVGWISLAERHGFAVLMPQQSIFNDPNYCFQWFNAWQQDAEGSEPVSIHSMIVAMLKAYGLDRRRIFVTGHSAGGSMALILMASYPDLIAGGGVFGSLPVGQASVVLTAPVAMAGIGSSDPRTLARRIQEESNWRGPWPPLSVWQGLDDPMVAPSNGPRVRDQWRALMGLDRAEPRTDQLGPFTRETWYDTNGRPLLQYVALQDVGHSVPVDARAGCGRRSTGTTDLVSDVGVCSSLELLRFWGVVE